MSSHGTQNAHPPGHESEDAIDYKKVILVGVFSLMSCDLGVACASAAIALRKGPRQTRLAPVVFVAPSSRAA